MCGDVFSGFGESFFLFFLIQKETDRQTDRQGQGEIKQADAENDLYSREKNECLSVASFSDPAKMPIPLLPTPQEKRNVSGK